MDINFKLNGKSLIGLAILSAGLTFANYVSIIDAKSAGGIIVEEEQVPVGSVTMWTTNTPPKGWLAMNGQSTAGYPELAKIVGSNVPDLSGKFVRAFGGNSDSLGVVQSQSVQALTFKGDPVAGHSHTKGSMNITGYFRFTGNTNRGASGAFANASWYSGHSVHGSNGSYNGTQTNFNAKNSWTGSTSTSGAHTPTGVIEGTGIETRPENVALLYIIKAE